MPHAYIVDAVRTPRGRGKAGKGSLSGVHPQELLAQVLNALAARHDLRKADVEDVIMGCVTAVGEQGANIARTAVLAAGWPDEVPGVTLNRMCGSGLQAITFAAFGVMSGQQDLVIAGGVESMSRVAMGSDTTALDANNLKLRARTPLVPQGISADLIATREGIGRAELDAWGVQSQGRAARAVAEATFRKSLIPVRGDDGQVLLDRDETVRAGTTLAQLGELPPAFAALGQTRLSPEGPTLDDLARSRYPEVRRIEHLHTAGTSSGIVDGAAATLIASEAYLRKSGLKARARLRTMVTAASEPVIMLTAPAPASERALRKAGMRIRDVDLWEINEAFAVVPVQVMRKLELDPARVNVNGGAIALGHPLGATGAMLLATALDELERRDASTALVTLCIGGGMAVATILERV